MKSYDHTNLVPLYLTAAGTSEVPTPYHLWSILTLVSACLQNRVTFAKFRKSPLVPNLYTFLVGPSGLGKGEAITVAQSYAAKLAPAVDMFAGDVTAQGLIDHLQTPEMEKDEASARVRGKVFLVTEELAMSVGEGQIATDFLKHMTGLYKSTPYEFRKRTVTRGSQKVAGHCITWIAGTTRQWLVDCVPRHMIEGGFVGRVACVGANYDFTKRYVRPAYPVDEAALSGHILERLAALTGLAGPCTTTREFDDIEEQWYLERPAPEDEALWPSWKREHDLVLKLAMVLMACEPWPIAQQLRLDARHIVRAQQLTRGAMASVPALVAAASATRFTANLDIVQATIERAKAITFSSLLRRLSGRGISGGELKEHLRTLVDSKVIKVGPLGSHRYEAVQRAPMPTDRTDEPARNANDEHEHDEEHDDASEG